MFQTSDSEVKNEPVEDHTVTYPKQIKKHGFVLSAFATKNTNTWGITAHQHFDTQERNGGLALGH